MNNILYLPLDERPCNYYFPLKLLNGNPKYNLLTPNKNVLGKKKNPSKFEEIKNFLLENAKNAKIAVISLDQLLYGGIVPSRLHHLSYEEIKMRLSLLEEIKKINKNLILYCFVLIMRCPAYSSSDEEPDYYKICGKEIYELGVKMDKGEEIPLTIKEKVAPYLDDYLKRRKTNFDIILDVLKMTDKIDFLCIPQDDSSPFGFTTMDKRKIFKEIEDNNYDVLIYPGADEVGMSLISRSINTLENDSKMIYVDYMYQESQNLVPAYENVFLKDTVFKQIIVSGNKLTTIPEKADIIIFANYDKYQQLEASKKEKSILDIDVAIKQVERIKNTIKKEKTIGLVDKYYVNGGNLKYLQLLSKEIDIFSLDAYAGWNTSSNSLGTVIAVTTISSYFKNIPSLKMFLAERLYDDCLYQGEERFRITNYELPKLGYNYFDVKEEKGEVANLIAQSLTLSAKTNLPVLNQRYEIKNLTMPWHRMFEIFLELKYVKD